jgi:ribosomal protein S18 acetylase RimI-like enzyme
VRTERVPEVRRYIDADFDPLVRRWHETNRVSYPYVLEHQRHTLEDATTFFRNQVIVLCEVWVAVDRGTLLGLLALQAPWIRQLAVFPESQRRGVGSALLRKAQERSPAELRLFTFQRNRAACAFYEKRGFHHWRSA